MISADVCIYFKYHFTGRGEETKVISWNCVLGHMRKFLSTEKVGGVLKSLVILVLNFLKNIQPTEPLCFCLGRFPWICVSSRKCGPFLLSLETGMVPAETTWDYLFLCLTSLLQWVGFLKE